MVQISELYSALFVFGDESRERDVRGSTGWDPYSHPEREDRVQHCSYGSSQLRTFIERHRISYRPAATNEFCAIRFAGDITNNFLPTGNDVCTPDPRLRSRTRATCGQERRFCLEELCLHEQISKRGMRAVGIRRCQYDFGVARQLDVARQQRPVRQQYPANFGSIIGCNCNFGHRIDVTIAPDERDAIAGEENAVPLRLCARGLMGRRPDMTGAQVLYVAPLTEVVARAIVSPPRHCKIPVTTEPAAGIRDQSGVRYVSENSDDRLRCMRSLDLAHRRFLHLARHSRNIVALNILNGEPARDALLQDQLGRAHQWIHVEAARPYLPIERVVQCDDAHPDVMRHERAHDGLSGTRRRTRVVERVPESVGAQCALCLESRKILERLTGFDEHREQRRIWCNHQLLTEPALEREIRDTEAAILISVRSVTHCVR